MARGLDLSIIIVNWNSRERLKTCIASIREHTRTTAYEIIVIDSASYDGCDLMLRERYPDVRFIQSSTNLGFARANNRAFEESVGDAVLFLNPDTELVGPAIDVLYASLRSLPDAGIVGGKLLNSDGTVQSSCIQAIPTIMNQLLDSEFLRTRWPRSRLWGTAPLYEETPRTCEVEAISGAGLMVKRKTFEEVGRFSEDYFMYAEDIDLSYKVRDAGRRNYYVPDATVIHHGGGSTGRAGSTFAAVMIPEAIWRFLRKTRGRAYGLGYRLAMLVSAIGRLGALGLARRTGHRSASREASRRKWRAVLVWSVNRHPLVRQYYPVNRPSASFRVRARA